MFVEGLETYCGVLLIESDVSILKEAALDDVVELEECSDLVTAYLAKVVGALAADVKVGRVQVLGYGDGVEILVEVVTDAEAYLLEQVIDIKHGDARGVEYFFTAADDLFGTVIVDVPQQWGQ